MPVKAFTNSLNHPVQSKPSGLMQKSGFSRNHDFQIGRSWQQRHQVHSLAIPGRMFMDTSANKRMTITGRRSLHSTSLWDFFSCRRCMFTRIRKYLQQRSMIWKKTGYYVRTAGEMNDNSVFPGGDSTRPLLQATVIQQTENIHSIPAMKFSWFFLDFSSPNQKENNNPALYPPAFR